MSGEKWPISVIYCSVRDILSFRIPEFELFSGCTVITSPYLYIVSLVIDVYGIRLAFSSLEVRGYNVFQLLSLNENVSANSRVEN